MIGPPARPELDWCRYARDCDRNRAEYQTEHDADEDCSEIRIFELYGRVAERLLYFFDVGGASDHCESVAELQNQFGGCHEV